MIPTLRERWSFMFHSRTQNRGSVYEVELKDVPFLREESVANVQGVGSIARVRLERRLGSLQPEALAKIKEAIRFAMEL